MLFFHVSVDLEIFHFQKFILLNICCNLQQDKIKVCRIFSRECRSKIIFLSKMHRSTFELNFSRVNKRFYVEKLY